MFRRLSPLLAPIAIAALLLPACSSERTISSASDTDPTESVQPTDVSTDDSTEDTIEDTDDTDVTTDVTEETDDTTDTTESTDDTTSTTKSTTPGTLDGPLDLSAESAAAAGTLDAVRALADSTSSTIDDGGEIEQPGECPLFDHPLVTGWGIELTGSVFCEGGDDFAIGATIDPEAQSVPRQLVDEGGEVSRDEPYANGDLFSGCFELGGADMDMCIAAWTDENLTVLAVGSQDPAELEDILLANLEDILRNVADIDTMTLVTT